MKTAVKERPILFSGPMVRAILDGRKTQTRRVAKLTAGGHVRLASRRWHPADPDANLACPYGHPGDRLYVREIGWYDMDEMGDIGVRVFYASGHVKFMRTGKVGWAVGGKEQVAYGHWEELLDMNKSLGKRPSIHMPRWASRITLEVAGVRVERIHDISEEDAKAEGVEHGSCTHPDCSPGSCASSRYRPAFASLWDSINAKRGFGWDVNPWVWVVEFRRSE